MRIVSLLPAATDWLVAFGATRQLVGRTDLCDAPETAYIPIVARSSPSLGTSASEIDASIRGAAQEGLSLFTLDLEALRELQPDLIVTQSLCGVCAPPLADVTNALVSRPDSSTELIDFAPCTHKQILDAALELAARIGRIDAAMPVVASHERQLRAVADRVGGRRQFEGRPTVVCIEWVEPPMMAGHWTPDLVEHAGGRPLLSVAGERSRTTSWEDVAKADPDVLVVAACGRSVPQSLADLASTATNWQSLRAVQDGRAVVFEGDRLFNRPGPALARSVEGLAWALWGEASGVEMRPEEASPFPATPVVPAL